MSPMVQMSSKMPSAIQAARGNAPKDGTSWLIFLNMKIFMTPDEPYRSAANTCRIHNSMFIMLPGLCVSPAEYPKSLKRRHVLFLRNSGGLERSATRPLPRSPASAGLHPRQTGFDLGRGH